MPLTYRTVWISDVHLGTPASRASDLLGFLNAVRMDKLYLAGDIVDLERMKVRPRFPESHREVVTTILRLAASGTEVVYIPGNHDFEFRDLTGNELCGVPVRMDAEHLTADGRRLLVMHGDLLDREIRLGTNLEAFGAAAYNVLLQLDVAVNQLRSRLGRDYLSISERLKGRLASANEYIRRFEDVAARHARDRGFDGIVCGHIHRPGVRHIDGVLYANDGDWVEHRTALAESASGRLELLRWRQGAVDVRAPAVPAPMAA